MIGVIDPSWRSTMARALAAPEAQQLREWLQAQEHAGKTIYPPQAERARALELTPLDEVKVVILGQDPYHGPGQAHGLAFSVPEGVPPPPSLANIFRERRDDLGLAPPAHGNLTRWARAGVLLLNNTLTVEAGRAGSHAGQGWEAVTDAVVAAVAARPAPTVFVLWGRHAQGKAGRIANLGGNGPHLIIKTAHPSPLSAYRGFFGSRPFSQTNAFLEAAGRGAIDWRL